MATSPTSAFKASTRLRTRRQRLHLDMTPMVGLAFLLLTFFLLHAGAAKPRVLLMTMPVEDKAADSYGVGSCYFIETVTIILGGNHQLHYYFGLNNLLDPSIATPELRTTDFSASGIRQMLLTRRRQQPEPVILIKPAPGATYKDMVDILDEINITAQKKYALVPLGTADRQLLLANGWQ
jgi:biopolymer transport protein ExbD